jgi:hypothetical protein
VTANSQKQAREGGSFAAQGRAPGRALAGTGEANFARPGGARFTRELGGGFAAREAHKCASGAGAGGGFVAASRHELGHGFDQNVRRAELETRLKILPIRDASWRAKTTASMGRRCARATRSLSTPTKAHMTHPLRGDGKAHNGWLSASHTPFRGLCDVRQTAQRIKSLRAQAWTAALQRTRALYHECHTSRRCAF